MDRVRRATPWLALGIRVLSYEDPLNCLILFSHEKRRARGDLTKVIQMLTEGFRIPVDNLFTARPAGNYSSVYRLGLVSVNTTSKLGQLTLGMRCQPGWCRHFHSKYSNPGWTGLGPRKTPYGFPNSSTSSDFPYVLIIMIIIILL